MTTLTLLFLGQLLVFADLRAGTVDVLPDPIGWAVTAVALVRLMHHTRLFAAAAALTVIPGVLSLLDWVYPLYNLPTQSSVVTTPNLGDLITTQSIYDLGILAILELTTVGLAISASRAGDKTSARHFRVLAAALIGVELLASVVLALAVVEAIPVSMSAAGVVFRLLTLAVQGWWLFVLWTRRDAAWGHHALSAAELDRIGDIPSSEPAVASSESPDALAA